MSIQLVVASGTRAGQVIPIVGERFVIGRADDCHLKPRSELVSRYHCEIFLKEGNAFVRDMGSKNGVFLNENQISEVKTLNNGDRLAVGPLNFFVNITVDMKPQKAAKVKSVSDAIARTVELQSEGTQKNQDDTITDWLLAAGEGGDELETRTVDAAEMMAHLNAQSDEAANREREEEEAGMQSGISQVDPSSSQGTASELLRKFFKGGK
ncbi:MAG: FHA domain-containing protein [Planctomycetaceae bacterium]|jgi:pSer/pThr/pTyr-binding forkhead associated (FHA) protein|nr:FHA domain-containing protein [Planctomycetaceae bacterium]